MVTSGVRSGISDSVSFQRKDGVGRREVGSAGGDGGDAKTQPATRKLRMFSGRTSEKREIKRLVRTDPNISFGALRSEAIQQEEDGLSGPHRSVRVREVHEPRHASDDPSPLERIAAQLELLATTQSKIMSLLRAQQQTAAGVAARPSRPEPRSSESLHCEYCRGKTTVDLPVYCFTRM